MDLDEDELKATRKLNGADICVGDYVRDCDGSIYKVTEIIPEKDSYDVYYKGEGLFGTYLSMIKKHSKNIIDLIEVNDILTYEHPALKKTYLEIIDTEGHLEILKEFFEEKSMIIKSVVTKEQFSSMQYIVKED